MQDHEYTVILVSSTNHAIRAEKALGEANIPCKLVPVPRHISSDCGVCVRIFQIDRDQAIRAMEDRKVAFESAHDV